MRSFRYDPKDSDLNQNPKNQMLQEKEDSKRVKFALHLAYQKGLVVKKNQLTFGWSIYLPNGNTYLSPTLDDMTRYVKDY